MNSNPAVEPSPQSEPQAEPEGAPQRRPEPKLSGRGLSLSLLLACLVPLGGLSIYAMLVGGAYDKPLPVKVELGQRPVPVMNSNAKVIADVVILTNLADYDLPRLTIDLNGQYFLHQNSPLTVDEELVLPLAIFSTKSNQRWEPGAYPLTSINVTAQLPSRSRGVLELKFDPPR